MQRWDDESARLIDDNAVIENSREEEKWKAKNEIHACSRRSVVEVFANGRLTVSSRVYPTKEDSGGVSLYSKGGNAELVSLDAWQMHSVWPELKLKEGVL